MRSRHDASHEVRAETVPDGSASPSAARASMSACARTCPPKGRRCGIDERNVADTANGMDLRNKVACTANAAAPFLCCIACDHVSSLDKQKRVSQMSRALVKGVSGQTLMFRF